MTDAQKAALKEALAIELQKFLGSLDRFVVLNQKNFSKLNNYRLHHFRAINQMEGEIKLRIPNIPELRASHPDILELANNKNFVSMLENLVNEWEQRIGSILKEELPKVCWKCVNISYIHDKIHFQTHISEMLFQEPTEFTPLSELEYWRDRHAMLSSLDDQLQTKTVKTALQVLQAANSDALPPFELQRQELQKALQEARDISRFLPTIERHLKTLTYSKSFVDMAEAIPHIMEGLQLIWTLSRHYNKDERMLRMLEMIAKLLYDRTTEALHPTTLFKLWEIMRHEVIWANYFNFQVFFLKGPPGRPGRRRLCPCPPPDLEGLLYVLPRKDWAISKGC